MTTKKYSLRKVKVGVASVLVGFGVATTGAAVANAADATETAAQKEFLANYDKALTDSVAELEKAETTSPEEAKQKDEVLAKLKEDATANKAEIEEAFKNGATAAEAEKFLEEAAKTPEEAGQAAVKTPSADDKKKFDEADKAAKEYEANRPESAKKTDLADELAKEKANLAKQIELDKKEVEETIKEAEQAKAAVEKKAAELEEARTNLAAAEAIQEKDDEAKASIPALKQKVAELEAALETATNNYNTYAKEVEDYLKNAEESINAKIKVFNELLGEYTLAKYDALETEVKELEEDIVALEENIKAAEETGAGDDVVNEFKKALTEKKADLEAAKAKLADVEKELAKLDPSQDGVQSSNGDEKAPVVDKLPEFGANNPEIKKILTEMEEIVNKLESGDKDPKLVERLAELREAFDILTQNKPAVNEVPEFDLNSLTNGRGNVTPGAAGPDFGQKTEAKEEAKAETKEGSLPNTGMTTSSTAALGLSLIALVGLAVRRKLNN